MLLTQAFMGAAHIALAAVIGDLDDPSHSRMHSVRLSQAVFGSFLHTSAPHNTPSFVIMCG